MNRILILGVNGQDGSYLAETLTRRGECVLGIGRQNNFKYSLVHGNFNYQSIDLCDVKKLAAAIAAFEPTEVYHVAAVHGAAGFCYEECWDSALDVNVKSLFAVLEYAREQLPKREVRIGYASSAKVFGTPLPRTVSLDSPHRSDCLYSISKNTAKEFIQYYRRRHRVFASIAYLFNHESERRSSEYFLPILLQILADSIDDHAYQKTIKTLDFYCDWGSAREYMNLFSRMLSLNHCQDLILASGVTWYAREFTDQLFTRFGLDYRRHIIEELPHAGGQRYDVSISKTIEILGSGPEQDMFSVCGEILDSKYRLKMTA